MTHTDFRTKENEMNPQFMDAFELAILNSKAKQQVQQAETDTKAGDKANICVKVQEFADSHSKAITGNFLLIDYSEKALAVFGDTRSIKDQLKELGGRFNPNLTHDGEKKAGWIFSKIREQELRNLLTVK